MTAVLLTILKIIGIIILAVLAFVLVLAAIILFVPIRYRIKADKDKAESVPKAFAKVTFLLHALSGGAVYDKVFSYYFRIFGIKVIPRKKDDDQDTGQPVLPEEEASVEPVNTEDETAGESVPEEPSGGEDFKIDWNEEEIGSGQSEDEDRSEEDLFDKIEKITEGIAAKYDRFSDKYEDFRKKARYWDKMANDTRNREAVTFIKDLLLKVLKKIAPRSVKGYVHFGTDDPATTGKILMYLAIVYPILPRKLVIEPDFEDTDVFGKLDIKGRLRLITIGIAFLRLVTNKDCRRLWRLYKKHTG